jgi:hypothetical protein
MEGTFTTGDGAGVTILAGVSLTITPMTRSPSGGGPIGTVLAIEEVTGAGEDVGMDTVEGCRRTGRRFARNAASIIVLDRRSSR